MSTKHTITLTIYQFNTTSSCVEIVDFTDEDGGLALDYGKDARHQVSTGHIIRFESGIPFLFQPATPCDWEPTGNNYGAVWKDGSNTVCPDGSNNWGVAVLAKPAASTQYVLELKIKRAIPTGKQETTVYRIVGMTPSKSPSAAFKKRLFQAKKALCQIKLVIYAPAGGKSTIIITN